MTDNIEKIDDTELQLHDLLQRRAEWIDEDAITGDTVRAHAGDRHRHGGVAWAPVAAAAAGVALAAGLTVTAVHHSSGHTGPGTRPIVPAASVLDSSSPTPGNKGFGAVPPCPKTLALPGSGNTVCSVGTAPSVPSGKVVIRTYSP